MKFFASTVAALALTGLVATPVLAAQSAPQKAHHSVHKHHVKHAHKHHAKHVHHAKHKHHAKHAAKAPAKH